MEQDGQIAGAVLVILDVTEKEQRERLRREFTANVSHELKTPLTSILGTAEILQNGLVKPEDVPHFAGNIHRETERLIGLVNDIIKLSRLDEGGGLGQWETVDLYEEARAVLEQLAPAAQRKQVTTRLQGGEALVRGVPQIVEEIVYNLCDNAIAYNRANGSVTVTVENTAFGPGSRWRILASAFPGGPGPGIRAVLPGGQEPFLRRHGTGALHRQARGGLSGCPGGAPQRTGPRQHLYAYLSEGGSMRGGLQSRRKCARITGD